MGMNMNLHEKFDEYFDQLEGFGLRSERCYDEVINTSLIPYEKFGLIRSWLMAAFAAGAEAMSQDTLVTLGDYGTAVAGIDEVVYNRTQAYDAVAECLTEYYKQIFQMKNEDNS